MPEAVLPLLVGEDSGQTLEDVEVTFPSPAVDIEPPNKVVEVERCEAIPGKVIVVGQVIKSIWLTGDKERRPGPATGAPLLDAGSTGRRRRSYHRRRHRW